MNRNIATSVALIATTMFVPTASAMAQNREADIRYEAAQRRFDGELALFKAEVERYERARTVVALPSAAPVPTPAPAVAVAPVLSPVPAEAPRAAIDDSGREFEDAPRAAAPEPADRDDRDMQAPL